MKEVTPQSKQVTKLRTTVNFDNALGESVNLIALTGIFQGCSNFSSGLIAHLPQRCDSGPHLVLFSMFVCQSDNLSVLINSATLHVMLANPDRIFAAKSTYMRK